jgi:hypothetical protein
MKLRRRSRRQIYPQSSAGGFALTALGDVEILDRLGEGAFCTVYDAMWRGQNVALKIYKAGTIEHHHRAHGDEVVQFEWNRNQEFYDAPGLRPYVAEPLAYLCMPGIQALLQEKLNGPLYYSHCQENGNRVDKKLFGHIRNIVKCAHDAGIYDIDLHAGNLIVVDGPDGEPIPKLFDFNQIPFYICPPNPLVGLIIKLGLIDHKSRDLRKLDKFHDFTGVERKLKKFILTSSD